MCWNWWSTLKKSRRVLGTVAWDFPLLCTEMWNNYTVRLLNEYVTKHVADILSRFCNEMSSFAHVNGRFEAMFSINNRIFYCWAGEVNKYLRRVNIVLLFRLMRQIDWLQSSHKLYGSGTIPCKPSSNASFPPIILRISFASTLSRTTLLHYLPGFTYLIFSFNSKYFNKAMIYSYYS